MNIKLLAFSCRKSRLVTRSAVQHIGQRRGVGLKFAPNSIPGFLVLIGAWLLVRCYFVYERSQSQPLIDAIEAEARDCYRRYSNVASDVVAFVQERWAALMGQEDAGEGPAYELLDGGNSPDGL